ncbi:uncharacterized protein SPAPADRAFT_67808 [Spathaspora passalidarum NRRL Y-27907]|uniref:HTH La-type RNA-binding domain-containing protein n=1 Tax=Spathaspora passalidarum (strain NRRL Y-27907 / 11-Y1) TaxID=619300 RepID=G3ARN4_SPAPN|nr:uncharacterized protein SPAPADRAFT_67808 [Spathaspora passalidarum NRRL Y-27907]EGW31787.1 hypothetical protein SPAPADRAFT_67808 [Spathaspora passalidarum NRRL Y-27907]
MVNRLLPAPPPTVNAWSLNQLIENNPPVESNDEVVPSLTSPLISPEDSSPFTPHSAPPLTKRKSNKKNSGSVMIRIGKNTTIKKPTKFPQNQGNIKGGTGAYKYKIATRTDNYHYTNPSIVYPMDTSRDESESSPIQEQTSEGQFTSPLQTQLSSPIEYEGPVSPLEGQFPLVYPSPFPIPVFPIYPIYEYYPEVQSPKSSKHDIIKRQLEYYFSTENLCKDLYLRSLFNPIDGSVKLQDLIQFNRLKNLTKNGTDITLLIDAISDIDSLQLLENEPRVRLKNWRDWVN